MNLKCMFTTNVNISVRKVTMFCPLSKVPLTIKESYSGFPGGAVVKNPLANAGDTG